MKDLSPFCTCIDRAAALPVFRRCEIPSYFFNRLGGAGGRRSYFQRSRENTPIFS